MKNETKPTILSVLHISIALCIVHSKWAIELLPQQVFHKQ